MTWIIFMNIDMIYVFNWLWSCSVVTHFMDVVMMLMMLFPRWRRSRERRFSWWAIHRCGCR